MNLNRENVNSLFLIPKKLKKYYKWHRYKYLTGHFRLLLTATDTCIDLISVFRYHIADKKFTNMKFYTSKLTKCNINRR